MDTYLLNPNFVREDIIEGYSSLIWTERYDKHGDCTIVSSTKTYKPESFPLGWYLMNPESDDLMIIRSSEVGYHPDKGRVLTVKAKALTSILNQRIIWSQTNISTNLETAVKLLLDQNIINPSNIDRKVSNLEFVYSGATVPDVLAVEAQFQGQTLYDAISELCKPLDIGFRITYPSHGQFIFELYGGVNRSYAQSTNPHVVFSPEFDNLENASYFVSQESYCNVVLVGGEGQGNAKVFRTVNRSGATITGLNRFEHYKTAESTSSNGKTIPTAQYNAMLDQQGSSYLINNDIEQVFDGETDPTNSSGYGTTYTLGDIVQISDDEIIHSPARVVEYIRSDDENDGVQAFPALRL